METIQHGDYTTEYGRDGSGGYRVRQTVRGNLVLDLSAPDKESALSAARVLMLHELVRRDDLREQGFHDECEGCQFETKINEGSPPSEPPAR